MKTEHLKKIYDLLVDKLPEVLPELEPKKQGNKYYMKCPKCNEKTAYYYLGNKLIFCNRQSKCELGRSRGVSLWDYLAAREGWKDNKETMQGLAAYAGYDLPKLSDEEIERLNAERLQFKLNEDAFMLFRSWFMFSPEAEEAKNYLKGRGWSDKEIDDINDIGFYDKKLLEAETAAGNINSELIAQINTIRPLSWEDRYKLVIPWRNARGDIEAFQYRALDADKKDKYKFSPGSRGHILFQYFKIRPENIDTAYITEGAIDALRMGHGGLDNVVALGCVSLGKEHIELLKAAKIKHAVLMFDTDAAGSQGTEKVITSLTKADINPTVVKMPDGVKDPDEFLRAGGTVEQLKAMPRISWLEWIGEITFKDYKKIRDIDKKRNALDSFQAACTMAHHPADIMAAQSVLERYQIPREHLEETLDIMKKNIVAHELADKEREKREKLIKAHYENIRALESGAATESIAPNVANLNIIIREKKQVKDLITRLTEKCELEETIEFGALLGYRLSDKFKKIQDMGRGIRPGLYLFGAGPNVGKTALTMNLALDLVKENPGIKVLIYTLDDGWDTIGNRLLGIISGVALNDIAARRSAPGDLNIKVKAAYELLKKYIAEGRLNIKDIAEIGHVNDIEADIMAAQSENRPAVVIIDALFNLQVDSDSRDLRAVNIDRANQIKRIVDIYNIPLFCTIEIIKNKNSDSAPSLSDIMESGKFGYNANMVYMLREHVDEEKKGDTQEETPETILVDLYCVKNKLGSAKGRTLLEFQPKTSSFKENNFKCIR